VLVTGAVVDFSELEVRDTQPEADGEFGYGVMVQFDIGDVDNPVPVDGSARIARSVIDGSFSAGLFAYASALELDGLLVRNSHGIFLQSVDASTIGGGVRSSTARIRGMVAQDVKQIAVFVGGSEADIEGLTVRTVMASTASGAFGDALTAYGAATVNVRRSLLSGGARAGVASFGATVNLEAVRLECNLFPLNAERLDERLGTVEDRGQNSCRCQGQVDICQVVSSRLEPPELLRVPPPARLDPAM
jgi:hypothetical protein